LLRFAQICTLFLHTFCSQFAQKFAHFCPLSHKKKNNKNSIFHRPTPSSPHYNPNCQICVVVLRPTSPPYPIQQTRQTLTLTLATSRITKKKICSWTINSMDFMNSLSDAFLMILFLMWGKWVGEGGRCMFDGNKKREDLFAHFLFAHFCTLLFAHFL
jgi:hypothetical protein